AAVAAALVSGEWLVVSGEDRPSSHSPPTTHHSPLTRLHPKPPQPVAPESLQAAIDRGVAFLLKDQNKDGSWGKAGRTKDLNIMAGVGSHHAFRTAVTALCVSALIEVDGAASGDARPTGRTTHHSPLTTHQPGRGAVLKAIERGEAFLFRELPRVRRDT